MLLFTYKVLVIKPLEEVSQSEVDCKQCTCFLLCSVGGERTAHSHQRGTEGHQLGLAGRQVHPTSEGASSDPKQLQFPSQKRLCEQELHSI